MATAMRTKAKAMRDIVLLCALLFAVPGHAQQQPPPGQAQQLSPRQWADNGNVALSKGEHRAAADAFKLALAGGFRHASVYAELAAAQLGLGDRDAAIAALDGATAAGLRMPGELQSALSALHGHPRWPHIVAKADANLRDYRASHSDPEAFRFISSDIGLFWNVVDRLPGAPDPALLLDREYLDKGTPGLHGFIFRRIGSGAKLHAALTRYPKYYAAVRPHSLQAVKVEGDVRAAMRSFKGLYDKALFPDVYFVIGAMSSGGTASMDGLIIGTEVFSRAPEVPVDELSPAWVAGTKSASYLPSLVVHELMHFQQDNEGSSLLAASVKEGAADFLASLLVKGNFNEHVYAYGYANEAQLKQEFAAVMDGASVDGWLYSGGKVEGRPNDLGYFMGFRICQAYYQRAPDKRKAIVDILNVKDAKRFLSDSGYL
jgi:hypothetical protein